MSEAKVDPTPTRANLDPSLTGPGTLGGQILRSFWQPVQRSVDLAAGTARLLKVMSEEFTLYRGHDGQAVVLAPRCAHRRAGLWIGSVEDDCIKCLYHGWKYSADGQCVEAPQEDPQLVARVAVRSYPTREAYGLVFAFLGEGEKPPFPDIQGFSKSQGMDFESAPAMEVQTYYRRCNYWLNVEASVDAAHIAFTHVLSTNPDRVDDYTMDSIMGNERVHAPEIEETAYGMHTRQPITETVAVEASFMMPNAFHVGVPARNGLFEQFAWRIPIDDEQHLGFVLIGYHISEEDARARMAEIAREAEEGSSLPSPEECSDAILRGERTLRDFKDHRNLVLIEDDIVQLSQGAAWDEKNERLGQTDKPVIQARRMWRRDLRALVEGESPTKWTW